MLKGTSPAQWRVVWTDDPSTTATIAWSTEAIGREHTVHYQIKGSDSVAAVSLAETGRYTGGSWLAKELAGSRQSHRWVLAQYHRPVYPAVKTPSSGLKTWVPLFEKYNVDLVCEADGHNIKRTVPIRGGKMDPTGVLYIGEGGLGVPQRTPKTDRWYLQSPGMADKGNHVFVLTFRQDTIHGKCVLEGGYLTPNVELQSNEF